AGELWAGVAAVLLLLLREPLVCLAFLAQLLLGLAVLLRARLVLGQPLLGLHDPLLGLQDRLHRRGVLLRPGVVLLLAQLAVLILVPLLEELVVGVVVVVRRGRGRLARGLGLVFRLGVLVL